jgi:hypothetical protein
LECDYETYRLFVSSILLYSVLMQAFFMSMAQYVDAWETPVRNLGEEVRDIVQEVAGMESTA